MENQYYYLIVEGACIARSEFYETAEARDEDAQYEDVTEDSVIFWADIVDGELQVGEFSFEEDEPAPLHDDEEYDNQEYEEDAQGNL